MTNKSQRLIPYLMLAAAAALVVLFYYQTRMMNLDRHNLASQNVLHLKQLDTQLNEETLKAVSLQLNHFDTIVATVKRMKALDTALRDSETGLYGLVSPDVDSNLNTFRSLMLAKFDLVESIKRHTAIVRNTINYLPFELNRLAHIRDDENSLVLHDALSTVLAYNITPDATNRSQLQEIMHELEIIDLPEEDRKAINSVLVHMRANLNALDAISEVMNKYLQLPTTQTLDRIFKAHSEYSVSRIKAGNQFRQGILFLSLMLFVGMGITLARAHKAHDETERTSRQFRDAVESIGEGFAFFDKEGRLSFWNSTFAKLHANVGPALARGVAFDDFYGACVANDVYQDFVFDEDQHDAMSRALGHPYVVKAANNTWMLASDSRMADGGTVSVRIDVTDSKRAEEDLMKLSRAVEQSPATVVITDIDGVITYVNPKFEEITGYSATEAIGARPSMLSSGTKTPEEYRELWHTISHGQEWRGEFLNKRKDGTLFWEHASISPIKNDSGDITYYLAVKEDVTERKRTMTELMEAKEQAETASHAKTQFLANMSHELRTPLNAIIGFSEMIKGQVFGPVGNDNYLDYSANILSSGQHLLDVINDILDVSRIEAGTMTVREDRVDLHGLCHECLEMVAKQATSNELILRETVEENLSDILGDAIRVKQVLLNLLTNAIKFTPKGGKIDLLAHQTESGAVQLIVRDTGYGIPQDKLGSIQEPFEQVSDIYTRGHEGSGLGLYLVKSFVELHDGTLSIDSEVDHGTTVTVEFPPTRTLKS